MYHVDELVDVVSDGGTDRFVVEPSDSFDRSRSVSVLITLAVAVLDDTPPNELSPLYGSVDTTALDSIVDGDVDGTGLSVRFEYEGYDVRLRPGPRVALCPAE